eukprot:TRINITY_DN3120_c0_g2_i6.p1 TRINITY_DN3120_c0_g2~~TRINITY_DN3120_c0_g2_i6.p1  ORF type:complete len:790 (+),score=163.37 TRINITY_DN3120_c0_g2_i6:54-2423(+)
MSSPRKSKHHASTNTLGLHTKRRNLRYAALAAGEHETLDRHADALRGGEKVPQQLLRTPSIAYVPPPSSGDSAAASARKHAQRIIRDAVEGAHTYTPPDLSSIRAAIHHQSNHQHHQHQKQKRYKAQEGEEHQQHQQYQQHQQHSLSSALHAFNLTAADFVGLIRTVHRLYYDASLPSCVPVVEVLAPAKVFGDIHGQVGDLVEIFRQHGRPCAYHGDIFAINYIFNGDFVDRGAHSLEVVCILMSIKLVYGPRVTLVRGNHEVRQVNRHFGLLGECEERYGREAGAELYEAMNELFDHLPLAAVIQAAVPLDLSSVDARIGPVLRPENRILVLHGGIGSGLTSLDQLRGVGLPLRDPDGAVASNALWNDPVPLSSMRGIHRNARGDSVEAFGADCVVDFCRRSNLEAIIRSHECVDNGYEFFAGGMLLTVFSARNYCGVKRNHGAIILVTNDFEYDPLGELHGLRGGLLLTPLMVQHLDAHTQIRTPCRPPARDQSPQPHSQSQSQSQSQHSSASASNSPRDSPSRETSLLHQETKAAQAAEHARLPSPTRHEKMLAMMHLSLEDREDGNGSTVSGNKSRQRQVVELHHHADVLLSQSASFKRELPVDAKMLRAIQDCYKKHCYAAQASSGPGMTLAAFREFFNRELANDYCQAHVVDFYRAMDVDGSSNLSVEEFALGVLAMRNDIVHEISNSIGRVRLLYTFRFYNSCGTGFLTKDEAAAMIDEIVELDDRPEAAKLYAKKQQILDHLYSGVGDEGGLDFSEFEEAVRRRDLSGTSVLFRFLPRDE